MRHNSLRDLLYNMTELLKDICKHGKHGKDVLIESVILHLTGETLPPGSNFGDGARLDVRAKSIQVNTMVYHSFGSMGPINTQL